MAELAHASVLETALQTTTSSSFVQKVTLAKAGMTAGKTYWIMAFARIGCSNASQNPEWRLTHGTTPTEFVGSREKLEVDTSTGESHQYCFFTKWTQPGPVEDVFFELKSNGTVTARADDIQIIAIDLDGLIENTEYHFGEDDTGPTAHGLSPVDRASVTFTPPVAGHNWVVLAGWEIDMNSAAKRWNATLDQDSGTTLYTVQQEGHDTTNVEIGFCVRVVNLDASSHKFALQTHDTGTAVHDYVSARVLAIDLSVFEVADQDFNASLAVGSPREVAGLPAFAPTTVGDVLWLAGCVIELDDRNEEGEFVVQVGGANAPAGVLGTTLASQENNETLAANRIGLHAWTSGTMDIDVDGDTNGASTGGFTYCQLVAFSLELAVGGGGGPTSLVDRKHPRGVGRGIVRGV